jgi:hypothetical protein
MGLGEEGVGLGCFGLTLRLQSEAPLDEIEGVNVFSAHPLLMVETPEGAGLEEFGGNLDEVSNLPQSDFIEVTSLRYHWLDKRSTHSNWPTDRMNEELEPVSLSNQIYQISASPLLFDGLCYVAGLQPFGLLLHSSSSITNDLFETAEDLFDTLATEDFDPIVTEDDMDEISLG